MEKIEYGGYALVLRGQRWRFQVRTNGRKLQPSFETLDDAKLAIDQLRASRGEDITDSWVRELGTGHLTILEMCNLWFDWKTGPDSDEPIRARTRRDYRRAIDVHIAPLIGDADAATITTADLKRDLIRVCTSKTFARFCRTVLLQSFRWGLEERLVARRDNPCLDLRLTLRTASDGRNRKLAAVHAVTEDQIPNPGEIQKMLMWGVETGRRDWWLWVYIDATLGLRPSEVCALRVEDFDPSRGLVVIDRSAPDRSDPDDWHPKTATSRRTLAVGPEFFDSIAGHLPNEGWLFAARARGGGRPQRTHTATPCWPPDAPNREMRRMRRALGLSELYTPYSLRHFVATRLILQGKEEIQVAKFLGTSVEMLQKVYANHLDRHAQRDIGTAVTHLF
jgi:integrase